MVLHPGFDKRLLAGFTVTGGTDQDIIRDALRVVSVQSHAVWTLQRSGHIWETDGVLQGLRWRRCLVYLDDIISFGSTFGDALDNLTLIFERLRAYGLQLKTTKCHLFQSSVPFLGRIVGRPGLECDPKKIEEVKSWLVPDCLKSVHQFLGFVGYYRRFILNFADLASPLVALTGKDVPFVWGPVCSTFVL